MATRVAATSAARRAETLVWGVGVLLVAFGLVGLLSGSSDFSADPFGGDVSGQTLLGIEANGWTNALFICNGGLLILASATVVSATFVAAAVGLDFAGAAIAATIDGTDVAGIFAANGAARAVWAILAALLLALAWVLPRAARG